jgi:hypothetical protein
MGREPMRAPNALNGADAATDLLGQYSPAPLRGRYRFVLCGDLDDLGVIDFAPRSRARQILANSILATLNVTLTQTPHLDAVKL